jgi:ankyrin repeat protein
MDMLGAILENDPDKLENLVMQHKEHLNDPIGMPFDATGRFSGHPIMDQMVIGQHPGQTLLDVTCGMPCGPSLWVLISHGAKGSQHPLGSDLAFHNAIKNGRTVNVMVLARPGRSKVNGLPGTAWKPLLQAVYWNHPDIVRILLRRGANLEDAAPSPLSSGYQTPLQLSLERRARDYLQDSVRDNCNNIIRQLLEAGANIHAPPPAGSTATPFAMFMQPWQTVSFWSSKLSVTELDSLRMFLSGGASLQTSFVGCPCGSLKQIFKHQALWHSSPNVARLIVDSVTASTGSSNMSSLLHEVLGSCAESKRHPADTLRDLQVLLQRGANPNLAEINGVTPLRKCIERCPAVDLIARLKLLLDAGADPEDEDRDGIQPFVLAARTLEEPILSDVMQAMVSNMRGRYRRVVGGVVRTWSVKHFPISDTQNYEQVMSCTRNTGDFRLEMLDMVPEDIRDTFQRAYFTVVSKNFLDTMTRTAKSRMLTARDKDEIVWIIGMRRGIDLPEYRFDQELVIALLDPQTMLSMQANSVNLASSSESTRMTTETAQSLSNSIPTIDDAADESTPRATWQFNPNNPITTPPRANANETLSPESLDEDYIIPSTTLIRWRNPEAQPKPGDLEKACASVLRYECATCNDGVPLTKKEQERHGREHAHTSVCEEPYCARRFCALKNGKHVNLGCQDHIFAAEGTNVSYHPMSI